MLRLAVIVLLLANAGYYAWSQGLLRDWGLAPASDAEPQRLHQQVEPGRLRLLPGAAAASPAVPASAPASAASAAPAPGPAPADAAQPQGPAAAAAGAAGPCLQAGVYDARQADALRAALASWPQGSWQLDPTPTPGRWMVYMGRLADEDMLARKRAELRALKVPYDRPGAALEPGLSLGRFSTEEAAQRGLALLAAQGVRTARVVQERPETAGFTLRLPAAPAALRTQLEGPDGALAGRPLRPCA